MAGIPRTSVYFFFRSLAQSIVGHIQKENTEIIAAEMNNFLCFNFVFLWSHSGWPYY